MPRLFAVPLLLTAVLLGAGTAAPPAPVAPDAPELRLATAAESKAEYEKSVAPFIAKHCAVCHSAKKAEGDLDLTALDPDMKASTSGAMAIVAAAISGP